MNLCDPLSRLLSDSQGSFSYDDFGNLTYLEGDLPDVDNATNRFLSSEGFAYDGRGNMTVEPMDGWTRHLRWDAADRLMAAWSSANPSDPYAFAYDAGGERVLKYRLDDGAVAEATFFIRDEGGNVLTEFVWAPSSESPETGFWSRPSDHVFLGRNEIVRLDHEPLVGPGFEERLTTLVLDHLGSTRREVGDGGTTASLDYRPFGEMVVTQSGSLKNNARFFTAHEREFVGTGQDVLQGLDYMHARYYSPSLGRFATVDPVGGKVAWSQSWNRYSYVQNNPLLFVDPDGRSIWTKLFRVGKAVKREVTVVAEVREKAKGRKRALNKVKEALDTIEGEKRVVTTESNRQSRKLAAALDPGGKVRPARGFDQSPGYPEGVHPNSGPYSDVHIQNQAAEAATPGYKVTKAVGGAAFLTTMGEIFAPTSTALAADPQATTTEVVSAAVWDVTSTLDPIGLSDIINYFVGIE